MLQAQLARLEVLLGALRHPPVATTVARSVDGYLRIYDVPAFEAATLALLSRLFGLPARQQAQSALARRSPHGRPPHQTPNRFAQGGPLSQRGAPSPLGCRRGAPSVLCCPPRVADCAAFDHPGAWRRRRTLRALRARHGAASRAAGAGCVVGARAEVDTRATGVCSLPRWTFDILRVMGGNGEIVLHYLTSCQSP